MPPWSNSSMSVENGVFRVGLQLVATVQLALPEVGNQVYTDAEATRPVKLPLSALVVSVAPVTVKPFVG